MREQQYLLKLDEVDINDIAIAGGKNASLGEMMKNLSSLGIRIPDGFIVTVNGYINFLEYNGLDKFITNTLEDVDSDDLGVLKKTSIAIRNKIEGGSFPYVLKKQIQEQYEALSRNYGVDNADVAVRSSATAEDLPNASFAGQQDTFLNVSGVDDILKAIRSCFASLYTERAISYRKSFGFDKEQIKLSVCIQKMVRSDIGASGVAFSLDTESGFKDVVVINGTLGLGEMLVQGAVSPDEFLVFKTTLEKGFNAIIEKKIGNKDQKMIYSKTPGKKVKVVKTTSKEAKSYCLSDKYIIQLAKWVVEIEKYYSNVRKYWCPMDVEWALDGESGELFIVQARPETIHSRKQTNKVVSYTIAKSEKKEPVLNGIAVGDKVGTGRVVVVNSIHDDISKLNFNRGDVLLAEMTDPDWEPLMKQASAIITEKGGRTCHAAIVARELGVPAVVGCNQARDILKENDEVTVSCAEGDIGVIYKGILQVEKSEIDLDSLSKTITPVMLNIASPDVAFQYATLPHQGIGLARLEFIINNYIKIHPLALLNKNSLQDEQLKQEIESLIVNYKSPESYFVDKLSYGIAKIAASSYPKKVIVRFSDFKSNEYANLAGGKYFEPKEENPMIGWRGASRYYSEVYKEAFGLECKAIKNVRDKLGLDNVIVMIPFCRTVEELKKVYAVMSKNGLKRKENNLQVYLMAELPSNFIMAEEFAEYVDGFSIGSNDLTQLVLGLDRDSSQVAHLYDERNYAIKKMIRMLLDATEDKDVKIGICGQAPSDFPDFAQFLVKEGIDSISVTPDSFAKTVTAIEKIEKKYKKKPFTVVQNMSAFRLR